MSNPIPKLLFEAKKLFNPLSEKALSLPDKEFKLAIMYATPDERTEFLSVRVKSVLGFLKEYHSKLSFERFTMVVKSLYVYLTFAEEKARLLHSFLEENHCELSDERFCWVVEELARQSSASELILCFLKKYHRELSDKRFFWVMEEFNRSLTPHFLMDCYSELSNERFGWVVNEIDNDFEWYKLFFELNQSHLSDTHARLTLKKICLWKLDLTCSDISFRSVILKIKKADREWFIYPEHVECYSKLSKKRFLLVVRADPRQLNELPWEMANQEMERLIGILQESLDRIKAKKAWIEATDSGINCFPIVQHVLACLQGLVK
jgi:hypothetical protein